MNDDAVTTIASDKLRARISARGAELIALQDRSGADYLWNGDPAYWPRHAPLLFPMVGRATDDRIRVDGHCYPLSQHGFARDSLFTLVAAKDDSCTFALAPDATTRARYPFEFSLEASYRVSDARLSISAVVRNDGPSDMPCSFGFHPAFVWPLPQGGARDLHEIRFEADEPAPIRRLVDGLLAPDAIATPIRDRRLALDDALFAHDALVLDRIVSRRVVYRGATGPALIVEFLDMPQLGLWTRPGAGFVCIEPWQGFASPLGFDGEFSDRPGVVAIPPGASRAFEMTIGIDAAPAARV
jgi:galactose mutarotase-like enzyme